MATNVFTATRGELVARGFAPLAVVNARSRDPITLHSALRYACGIHPVAWLPAYLDWKTSTAPYSKALNALQVMVAQKVGRSLDVQVWSGRVGEQETLELLDEAASEYPRIATKAAPKLRRGCRTDAVGTLRVSGVQVAALAQLCEARTGTNVGRIVADAAAAAGGELEQMSNDKFLECLLRADPTGGDGDGPFALAPETREALDALAEAAARRVDHRVPRLLAALARLTESSLPDLPDHDLLIGARAAADPNTGSTYLAGATSSALASDTEEAFAE
jgi:hypothetical protein